MTSLCFRRFWHGTAVLMLLVLTFVGIANRAQACPFCSAVSLTFGEEITNAHVAVIAKLVEPPPPATEADSLEVAKAKFEIVRVLKGEEALADAKTLEAVYFGDSPKGTTFLVLGIDPPNINWSTPIAVTEEGIDYIIRSMALPQSGGDRLFFFQDYLESKDETLARDAYDEFAKAPYADVLELGPRMHHTDLVTWVQSPEVPVSRRRLYFTMLGAARYEAGVPVFETLIQSKDRQTKGALDALVAAYLTLKGADGMPLIENLFLRNQDAEYTDTYATIMALRFHGTEEEIIPRARLLEGLRLMLDRPQLADLVIPDLARWEDWSVIDKLVDLFKKSDEESSWVRVPVINYLRACPLPEAQERLEELAKIDPDSIKRANSFFPLGAAAGSDASSRDGAKAEESKETPAAADTKPDDGPAPSVPEEKDAPKEQEAASSASIGRGGVAALTKELTVSVPASAASTAVVGPTPSKPTAAVPGHLSRDAAVIPGPPARTRPVVWGMLAAAAILTGAFWGILKGGQRATE